MTKSTFLLVPTSINTKKTMKNLRLSDKIPWCIPGMNRNDMTRILPKCGVIEDEDLSQARSEVMNCTEGDVSTDGLRPKDLRGCGTPTMSFSSTNGKFGGNKNCWSVSS